jgi:hypothetical protein
MHKFLYSSKLIYILAVRLLLAFFLPDLIGPVPAILIGGLIIGFAFFVYNKWTRNDGGDSDPQADTDRAAPED